MRSHHPRVLQSGHLIKNSQNHYLIIHLVSEQDLLAELTEVIDCFKKHRSFSLAR